MTKKLLALFALLLIIAAPLLAQDTPVPTDEVAITLEATAAPTEQVVATVTESDFITPTPAASETPNEVTSTPQATPIVIIVTPPVDTPPPAETGTNTFGTIGWVIALLALSALAFVIVTWMRELRKQAASGDEHAKTLLTFVNAARDMLPVDQLLKLVDGLDARAKAMPTPGEVDDKVSAQIRAYVYEALGKELPAEPTTPGVG